jgi:hypothetical protein
MFADEKNANSVMKKAKESSSIPLMLGQFPPELLFFILFVFILKLS